MFPSILGKFAFSELQEGIDWVKTFQIVLTSNLLLFG